MTLDGGWVKGVLQIGTEKDNNKFSLTDTGWFRLKEFTNVFGIIKKLSGKIQWPQSVYKY